MVVLDTTVLSDLMHRLPGALDRLRELSPGEVFLTSPVAAEIRYGLERLPLDSRRRRNLEREYERLRSLVRWADWTEGAAEEFGRQKARLAEAGRMVEDMDVAIGSIAITLGARLATRNVAHMARLESLEVLDWS